MKRLACVFWLVVMGFVLNAAQVQWDVARGDGNDSTWWKIECLVNSYRYYYFEVFFTYDSGPYGRDWSLTPDTGAPYVNMKMYEAALGSLVNHETALNATPFVEAKNGFANTFYPIAESWTPVSGTDPCDIYFAIVLDNGYGEEVTGWVQIGMWGDEERGHIYMKHSAFDLDGGPMIVGGGAWEGGTPEPASGLLMFVGGAVLALRRRRAQA